MLFLMLQQCSTGFVHLFFESLRFLVIFGVTTNPLSELTNLPYRRAAMRNLVFRSSQAEQVAMREESWKIGKWTRGILQHDVVPLNPAPGWVIGVRLIVLWFAAVNARAS
jgi:hypothetical protein